MQTSPLQHQLNKLSSISFQSFENDWHVAKVEAEERSSTKSAIGIHVFWLGREDQS